MERGREGEARDRDLKLQDANVFSFFPVPLVIGAGHVHWGNRATEDVRP